MLFGCPGPQRKLSASGSPAPSSALPCCTVSLQSGKEKAKAPVGPRRPRPGALRAVCAPTRTARSLLQQRLWGLLSGARVTHTEQIMSSGDKGPSVKGRSAASPRARAHGARRGTVTDSFPGTLPHTSPAAPACKFALLNVSFAVKTGGPWRPKAEGFTLDLSYLGFPSSLSPVLTLKPPKRVSSVHLVADAFSSVHPLTAQSLPGHSDVAMNNHLGSRNDSKVVSYPRKWHPCNNVIEDTTLLRRHWKDGRLRDRKARP